MEDQTPESKKEEFQKYLDQSGVIEELTKMLVGLYEEPEKPNNAMEFLRKYFQKDSDVDIQKLQNDYQLLLQENEQLKNRIKELETEMEAMKPTED